MTAPWEREPEVGLWMMPCCYLDLHKIEDQSDVDWIRELREDGISTSVYESEEAALRSELASWHGEPERSEIQARLAALGGKS